jgi:hypothetical protein
MTLGVWEDCSLKECLKIYSNPVVALAVLIIASVICLIGLAVFGVDKVVLCGMAKADFARGLITYLFAVVTIGCAVALIPHALVPTTDADDAHEKRFQRGKEILSLLLGLFGTIVGFYFGSETVKGAQNEPAMLQVSSLDLSPQPATTTGTLTIRAVVKGGSPPYRYGIMQGKAASELTDVAAEGGWIVKQLPVRAPAQGESQSIHILIQDAADKKVEQAAPIRFAP